MPAGEVASWKVISITEQLAVKFDATVVGNAGRFGGVRVQSVYMKGGFTIYLSNNKLTFSGEVSLECYCRLRIQYEKLVTAW